PAPAGRPAPARRTAFTSWRAWYVPAAPPPITASMAPLLSPGMAAFLANIGANASHRARSPLFADGSFVLYPIPEPYPWAAPMRRLPGAWGDLAVHVDPDLEGDPPTYGDNCRTAGRAFSLRRAQPGDTIVFVARL